jgi:hypothetical protein
MDVCLLCLYVVLSCVGRGLCDGPITRPEESYHMFLNLCDKKPQRSRTRPNLGCRAIGWMDGWTLFHTTESWCFIFCQFRKSEVYFRSILHTVGICACTRELRKCNFSMSIKLSETLLQMTYTNFCKYSTKTMSRLMIRSRYEKLFILFICI